MSDAIATICNGCGYVGGHYDDCATAFTQFDNVFDGTWVAVAAYPKCDFCSADAKFDAVMKPNRPNAEMPWAFYCGSHFESESARKLGVGYGQELVVQS
jgi:hypothetical protein